VLDFFLIASGWLSADLWIGILKVAVGLGMVIFVHELGHFAVAKACGVKCEKFYLGFDIGGCKICRFTYGETEYGIGILPLGGYVKMLGQEDNPARLKEEIERAKQQSEDTAEGAEETEPENKAQPAKDEGRATDDEQIDVAAAEAALYDPRSYLAQSVPKRMAIISAGVIMNLIFAFFMAVVAYKIGVKELGCGVGQVIPGQDAWQKNIKTGDVIMEIAGERTTRFRDLRAGISLGDIEDGIPIIVRRPGVEQPLRFVVTPRNSRGMPMLGITAPLTTTFDKEGPAAVPTSAAERATPPFEPSDTIVKIDGTPIEDYAQLHAYLALHPDEMLKVTVERAGRRAAGTVDVEQVTVEVGVNPMLRLGLIMEMGEISYVQDDSPAEKAGIEQGDKIVAIDGAPPGDPMTLPARLAKRGAETITLTVEREGAAEPTTKVEVALRKADWHETPVTKGCPMTVPSLGIGYYVLNRVHMAIDGSPAAEAGLVNGDLIVRATIIPPPKDTWPEDMRFKPRKSKIPFDEENRNWPAFVYALQGNLPGTQVELNWTRQEEQQEATLTAVADPQWFNPDRGFELAPVMIDRKAENWGEATRWGWEETVDSTLLVYRFLQKLGSQISPTNLGGPISIFIMAKHAADEGVGKLLLFLTLLSANLAVINFLPIPLLDGGHMVLLTWEGIRRKPADERVQIALTYVGLVFILSLMVWVIGLDLVRFWSWL